MANALDGIRVIDLTVWFQGPVAAQHLADFGAEVIHIERPQGGDLARGVRTIKAVPVGDWNQYFLVINRNKKSMAVDLKEPRIAAGGRERHLPSPASPPKGGPGHERRGLPPGMDRRPTLQRPPPRYTPPATRCATPSSATE